MGSNYDRYEKTRDRSKDKNVHPIWRGIGCMMLILIPVMAYAAADLFLQAAPGWGFFPRSSDIYRNIDLQYVVLPFSIGQAVFTLFFVVLGFLLFSLASMIRFSSSASDSMLK